VDEFICTAAPEDRPGLVVALAARLAHLGAALSGPATNGNGASTPRPQPEPGGWIAPEVAARIAQSLTQAKAGAQLSSQEAQTVAAAATEQLRAIEELARGATELAQLATDLSRTVHFVRGHDGRA